MMDQPVLILVAVAPEREALVRAALPSATLVRVERPLAGALAAASTGRRIALVDVGAGLAAVGLRAIEELQRVAPAQPIVALADAKDSDLILQAMRAGAREFIVPSDAGELERVIGEQWRRLSAEEPAGRVVSMFPVKGGLGATTLATNLAGALAKEGKRVVLVDLDLQLGDVLVFLDAASRYTIADVLHNLKRLDHDLLLSSLARHSSGVYLLAQSDRLDEADKVGAAQIGTLLSFLARHFEYVVCDGLRGFDELALAALDASHQVMLVVAQDVPAVKNAQRCLDVMRRLGYGDDKLRLVVNRHQKSEIDLQSIADTLAAPVHAAIANDYLNVSKAINRGQLLADVAPRARAVEDLTRLSQQLTGGARRERKSFLRGLFGGAAESDKRKSSSDSSDERGSEDEPERAPEAV